MIIFLSSLTFGHDLFLLVLALLVLFSGSVVTMRLFARVRRSSGSLKRLWLFLAGFAGGGTVWSTHFISMLAHNNPLILGYDPLLTGVSLAIAIGITTLGFVLASRTRGTALIELGGLTLGLGISAMHYTGMAAARISGVYDWSLGYVAASIALGGFFGIVATNRIARPVTRFCKYGGAIAFTLAVFTMHFTAMTALTINPINAENLPVGFFQDASLATSIASVTGFFLLVAFITYVIDSKNAEEKTERYKYLAMHDPLTGTLNRTGCEERLNELLSTHADDTAGVAVVVLDINRFKEINDVHGNRAGDHLLREVSGRLNDVFTEGEFVGRFGGDEFLAVKPGIYSARGGRLFCERIKKITETPTEWEGVTLGTGVSIGLATYPANGVNASELVERANLALNRAKADGKETWVEYDFDRDEANREKSKYGQDLLKAIERGDMQVYFQPQIDIRQRNLCGVEALVRWIHPVEGIVSPAAFIPVAEENGSIVQLGDWVLIESCRQANSWPIPLKVAVNVASRQLADAGFPDRVSKALRETGLPASRLELEITESGIIADTAHALQAIRRLKDIGVKIAMDDFGTGYSSLSTLQKFPFDKIKIDRDFVTDIHHRKESAAIVQATVILGDSLNIPVLAEGVECEEQMMHLERAGCHEVQGYLFGKPMPGEALIRLFEEQARHKHADKSWKLAS